MDSNKPGVTGSKAISVMPDGMRVVIAIVFAIIALSLSIVAGNKMFTDMMVLLNNNETQAIVTKKEMSKGRSGISYFITYNFDVNSKTYNRTSTFGLLAKRTQINRVWGMGTPMKICVSTIFSDNMVYVLYLQTYLSRSK